MEQPVEPIPSFIKKKTISNLQKPRIRVKALVSNSYKEEGKSILFFPNVAKMITNRMDSCFLGSFFNNLEQTSPGCNPSEILEFYGWIAPEFAINDVMAMDKRKFPCSATSHNASYFSIIGAFYRIYGYSKELKMHPEIQSSLEKLKLFLAVNDVTTWERAKDRTKNQIIIALKAIGK